MPPLNQNQSTLANPNLTANTVFDSNFETGSSSIEVRTIIIQSHDAIRGPTVCGDMAADSTLMQLLGAKIPKQGEKEYTPIKDQRVFVSQHPPRVVLDLLRTVGFRIVGFSGADRGYAWTLEG